MTKKQRLTGLTAAEVLESRRVHGENVLTPPAKKSLLRRFAEKFGDPLIIVLIVAGVLSLGISFYEYYGLGEDATVFFEPVGIFVAILLATGLSFYFEVRADKEFALLNRVNDDEAVQVIRDGNMTEVPRRDVVVGDIVVLNTGDEIPADGRLLEATQLNVDESTLTGEPLCAKTTDPEQFDPDATFASDMVMRGTKVMEGHGVMSVTAVGDATENGRVFEAAQIDNSVKTPLSIQLEGLGHMISRFSYLIAGLVIVARMIVYFTSGHAVAEFDWMGFGAYFLQSCMIAVALVVVSVPEGLPMAVTLALAYSMRRMLRTNNMVRKMHACETMGAATVICTDKTGTLTQNRMQVYRTDFYGLPDGTLHSGADDGKSRLIELGIAVNSTAELDMSDPSAPKAIGNPTEGALLLYLNSLGVDYRRLRSEVSVVEELPFSTERKYMATVVRGSDGREYLFVKGAPEIVYGLCSEYPDGADKASVEALLLKYQNRAMRTLGFAFCELPAGHAQVIADGRLAGGLSLSFLGVAAISDPVRADVPDAVRQCTDAGIRIIIVTGDTPGTAKEIARQIGLWSDDTDKSDAITTGPEFAAVPDSELPELVKHHKIIARARPMDKKRLVEALQANGEVVAVTGDGTNDAPALKAAQVGLSMGDGTSVAKEASDITIVDNSFTSIGRAVMWGRSLYRNIQRFLLFQLTVNVVACLVVLCGNFMGMQSPLTVTQMLWVNLIMDTFAAMALSSLPPTSDVMKDRPRNPQSFIISRAMWKQIIGVGVILFAILIGILYYFEHTDLTSLADVGRLAITKANTGLSSYELTLFFSIFVFVQLWNLFNARAFESGHSALDLRNCGEFLLIVALIAVGQWLIVTIGGPFFSVTPLKPLDWLIVIASTSIVFLFGEITRLLTRRKN